MSRNSRNGGLIGAWKDLPAKTRQVITISALVVVVLAAGILTACALLGGGKAPSGSDGSVSSGDSTSASSGGSYNKNENTVTAEMYPDTVLGETKDAGDDYVADTLFIGDSNTYRFMSYGQTTLKNCIGVVNMGVQEVATEKCVKFVGYSEAVTIPEAITIMQPRRIVVSFGTNNTVGWTVDQFIQQYSAMLEEVHKAYTYADIIINAIPPVDQYHDNTDISMKNIDAYNAALVKLADKLGYKFLNSSETLKDTATGYCKSEYTISDGIHLNKSGVEALFKYFRTHSYITEDKRPTLKKVPDRDESEPAVITHESASSHGSSSTETGIPVTFIVSDNKMGYVKSATASGSSLTEHVPFGSTSTAVTAYANEGYEFVGWSCTSGSLSSTVTPGVMLTATEKTDKITVTATFKVAAITLSGPATVEAGKSITLTSNVAVGTWSVSDGSIATIANGSDNKSIVVTGKAAGSVNIRATAASDSNLYDDYAVTVMAANVPVTGVTLNQSAVTLHPGNSATILATVAPANAANQGVTWTSSNGNVATVSGGTITAVAVGSATVTVTTADGAKTASCTVTVVDHTYTSTVVPPTCTADGYTEHTCSCGVSYKDTPVAATGHTWGAWADNGNGTCTRSCSKCGETETQNHVDSDGNNICDNCGAAIAAAPSSSSDPASSTTP